MLTRSHVAEWATRIALVVFLFELGGSLYEHLVIDTAWPANPALIQPEHGGVDRKVFWIPLHAALTLALPIALWACWRERSARGCLLVAIGLYIAIRAWTFAYFVPAALDFETSTSVDREAALAWVRWSWLRAPLLIGAAFAVWRASRRLAAGGPP